MKKAETKARLQNEKSGCPTSKEYWTAPKQVKKLGTSSISGKTSQANSEFTIEFKSFGQS